MDYKNLKVLCVIKDNDVYTRVVRQDESYRFINEFGEMSLSSMNTPELRMNYDEKILFIRGDQPYADHEPHHLPSYRHKLFETVVLLNNLNNKLKEL
jgi:hypothetical protein